jgi:hypothetical protein
MKEMCDSPVIGKSAWQLFANINIICLTDGCQHHNTRGIDHPLEQLAEGSG